MTDVVGAIEPKVLSADEQLAAAKTKLAADAERRGQECMTEVQAALAKYRCQVVAHTTIFYDGRTPQLAWNVQAQP